MSEGDALLQSSVSLHKISLADLLQELQTSDDGLTSAQAKKKQAAVGKILLLLETLHLTRRQIPRVKIVVAESLHI